MDGRTLAYAAEEPKEEREEENRKIFLDHGPLSTDTPKTCQESENEQFGRNARGGQDFPAIWLNRGPWGKARKQAARNSDKHGYF